MTVQIAFDITIMLTQLAEGIAVRKIKRLLARLARAYLEELQTSMAARSMSLVQTIVGLT